MALKPILKLDQPDQADAAVAEVPLGGTREQAIQRLQVGLFGLLAILLLIGVANVFLQRAQQVEDAAVPDAAPTVSVDAEVPQQSDPLADAGVVPELPAEPEVEQPTEEEDAAALGQPGEDGTADEAERAEEDSAAQD